MVSGTPLKLHEFYRPVRAKRTRVDASLVFRVRTQSITWGRPLASRVEEARRPRGRGQTRSGDHTGCARHPALLGRKWSGDRTITLRRDATTFFAALNVKTSRVIEDCRHSYRAVELPKLLDRVDDGVPADVNVHLSGEHYVTHTDTGVGHCLQELLGRKRKSKDFRLNQNRRQRTSNSGLSRRSAPFDLPLPAGHRESPRNQ